MQLEIEYLDKRDLKPYANNAKIHTSTQIEQIKKSISQFGFDDPIAVWGENEIVEGHGRLLAVMQMDEIKTVPVIRLDGLTDNERKAYALAHNSLAMKTGFSLDILANELEHIRQLDMTVYGFDEVKEVDIDDLFRENPLGDSLVEVESGSETEEFNEENDLSAVVCPYCGKEVVLK